MIIKFENSPTEFGVVVLDFDAGESTMTPKSSAPTSPHLAFIKEQFTRDSLARVCPDKVPPLVFRHVLSPRFLLNGGAGEGGGGGGRDKFFVTLAEHW